MTIRPPRLLIAAVAAAAILAGACTAATGDDSSEPLVIGLVTNNPNGMRNVAGFIEGMETHGYVDGVNVQYLFAGAPVGGEDLTEALTEMVDRHVDLIFTAGTPTGVAARTITAGTDIPVVFGVIADPIRAGVLADLTRPGGNMTGVKTSPDQGRRLELLTEISPEIRRIYVPYNPNDAAAAGAVEQITGLAPHLSVQLELQQVRDDADVHAALDALSAGIDAIFIVPDSLVSPHLSEILAVAAARGIPTSGPSTLQVENGALVAFGFVHREAGIQAARIADQVLSGADPADLPIETTESFLAINLETAELIGLEIPEPILRQAAIIVRPADS